MERRIGAGLVAVVLLAATGAVAVELENPGFERLAPDGSVPGWTLDTGSSTEAASLRGETVVFHSGVGSLRLGLEGHGTATVISDPVSLEVGHLYRLRAWIRTEGAISDPQARYPTAVPACLTMASFPFTNHSPAVGADAGWTRVETLFLATRSEDRVRLHLGFNGWARGTAFFDDVALDEVEDITELIPLETVRWADQGFRYDDRGWIFVHIEGQPYARGYQYGYLVADEIVAYITKLGTEQNEDDPEAGWSRLRFEADALFLRGYDEEYLEEMRGIADGCSRADATLFDRPLDLLDVVTLNSIVDLLQLHSALRVSPHALTGESFLAAEEELDIDPRQHKCSAFAATGPATADGEVVFAQIFMWYGYTGVHWNVICDVVPSAGHRLVYQTFPGGIHSGSDFYINDAGIVIGETTVSQTPYEPDSTPQSNRIRKAAQYASTIDEVVDILWRGNNGMYTNDWPIADIKTGEVAILLMGTHAKKLWRTGENMAPFGTPGFLWANNNNRDPEVRKEYLAQPDDRPFDLAFSPWNRDLAFNRFYRENKGRIDAQAAVRLWASSPVNRAHACDGKITTSEMARQLMFLAHYGKVTLREKFPDRRSRIMPDRPGAIPHLSLGYSVVSPVFVADKLMKLRDQGGPAPNAEEPDLELGEVEGDLTIDRKRLWKGTVYPTSDADRWFVSASAAYWEILEGMGDEPDAAARHIGDELAALSTRYLYTVAHEDDLPAVAGAQVYDRYGPYRIPRIKGTFALHQLRLLLGTERFLEIMRALHERFAGREMSTADFIAFFEERAGPSLEPFIRQWLERQGLPVLKPAATVREARGGGWDLSLAVAQERQLYHLVTLVEVEAGEHRHLRRVELAGKRAVVLHFEERPTRIRFNVLNDVPVARDEPFTWGNIIDDFHDLLIVYGTERQDEANHTLAQRFQETVANAYIEILPPLVKDSELTGAMAAGHDLMVLGSLSDSSLIRRLADELPVELGHNFFRWQGATYAHPDDGLVLVVANPFNRKRVLYLVLANSALELYRMTSSYPRRLPSWALYRGEEIVEQGYHDVAGFTLDL